MASAASTPTSALVALRELGARRVEVVARRPQPVLDLAPLADELGVEVVAVPLTTTAHAPTSVTIATLPGDAPVTDAVADALAGAGGPLMDVVYGHWPTTLSSAWQRAGHPAVSGLGMLLHQALLQVRIFATGDPDVPVDDETAVLAAMRQAIMGD